MYSVNATARITGYSAVNRGSKLEFSLAVTNPLPSDVTLKLDLPKGFSIVEPICIFGPTGEYLVTEALPDPRKVVCKNIPIALQPGSYYNITLTGVVNPNVTGIYTNFRAQFMKGDTPNVLESLVFPSQIEISQGDIQTTVVSSNLYRRSNATHIFQLTFSDDVPSVGQIWIVFSNSFTHLSPNCTVLKGADPLDSSK